MASIYNIIENIVGYLPNFRALFYVICFATGLGMLILSLQSARKRYDAGPGQQSTWSSAGSRFIIAGCFMAMPAFIDVMSISVFGEVATQTSDARAIFSRAPDTAGIITDETARENLARLVMIVQFFGAIAMVRGLLLMNAHYQQSAQQATLGAGFTFLVAGTCGINFPAMMGLFDSLVT